jgi:hypothetical protein
MPGDNPEAEVAERRHSARHLPALGVVCRLHPESQEQIEGLVWNLSATGVSMLLPKAPSVGDILRCFPFRIASVVRKA